MVGVLSKEIKEHVFNGGFIECSHIHDGSCEYEAFKRFMVIFKLSSKFYLPIHLVPTLIFQRKKLVKNPRAVLWHFLKGYIRSVLMLALFVTIFRYFLCVTKNTRHKVDKWNPTIAGMLCPVTIMLEPAGRRTELTLYLIPRFAEALWNFLLKKNLVKNIRNGEVLLFAVAMSVICYSY